MGIPILIIGKSGSGKSYSLHKFEENEIGLINVSRKPLPFKKKFKSQLMTDSYESIENAIDKTTHKTIIIDDAGYLLVNQFMRGHAKAGKGNDIFAFFNKVGDSFWNLLEKIKDLSGDKLVYILMHEDKNDYGDIKPKTIGKMLDEKVCIEGMFTICLRAVFENNQYLFQTQSDGFTPCKTPYGMFENRIIENDLKFVDARIRAFYLN